MRREHETARTPSSAEFYRDAGQALVDERNYPPAIVDHLIAERAWLKRIIHRGGYSAAIEVGCADGGVHLETLLSLNIRYLGIDLVPRLVSILNDRLKHRPDGARARACVMDARRLSSVKASLRAHKVLVVFPFNSFGNLEDPRTIIAEACGSGFDALILTYRTDPLASRKRLEYYSRCNLARIDKERDSRGVVFLSPEGLRSYAYHRTWLTALLRDFPLSCTVRDFGAFGRFYWCRGLQEN
jgi:hypothetical protein